MFKSIFILIMFSLSCKLSAQTPSTDSARIAAFYNGTGDDPYLVTDSIKNGLEFKHYVQLDCRFFDLKKIEHIDHLNKRKVVGIWVNDTIIPKMFRYHFELKKNHDFLYYDSVETIADTISYTEIHIERILSGKWKIQHDTLYTMITGCIVGKYSSWEIDAGSWEEYILSDEKLYIGPEHDGKTFQNAWRFKKLKNGK